MTPDILTLREMMVIPAVSSSYNDLGVKYKHRDYKIYYANQLLRTREHYYHSKLGIPSGMRMSKASEGLAIQHSLELAGKDPRKSPVFNDLFARGPDKIYVQELTETFLRVPKDKKNPDKPDYIDPKTGYKYWAREVGNGSEVEGIIYVPEGNGRLVAEWDEVFGIPRVTVENQNWPHIPYNNHFWFNTEPLLDGISNNYDVAVMHGCNQDNDVGGMCLAVLAFYTRLHLDPNNGFRIVKPSLERKVEKELIEKKEASFTNLQ